MAISSTCRHSTQFCIHHGSGHYTLNLSQHSTSSSSAYCIWSMLTAGAFSKQYVLLLVMKCLRILTHSAWRVRRRPTCRRALPGCIAAYRRCSGITRSAIRAVAALTRIVLLEGFEESGRMDTRRTCSAAVHRARFTSEICYRRSDNGERVESTNILVMLLSRPWRLSSAWPAASDI